MNDELSRDFADAARVIQERVAPRRPTVGLVLGSGLGAFADTLEDAVRIGCDELPGFARSGVAGHDGRLVCGRCGATTVLAMQGRVHFYEGHDAATVVRPVRALVAAGARTLVLTNAAGGVNPIYEPGEIVLVKDHLNLTGQNPLRGPNDERLGPRFPDLSAAYAPALRELARSAAARAGMALKEGVYAGLAGPSYETPAEIRMLRVLGADMVGMSTVLETIAAVHMGARVLALSCVTNQAAGLSAAPLRHEEVTEVAARVRDKMQALLAEILRGLA